MSIGNSSPIAREFLESGRCESCPIIDMHGHFGPFHGGYLPVASADKTLKSMARAGVRTLVISAHDALFVDVDYGNGLIQRALDEHGEQFLGYWSVNPNHPHAVSRAARDFENSRGFVGFKFLPDYHTYPVTGDGYAPVLEYADRRELPVLVHTWGGSAYDSPRQVAGLAAKYPGATFIMGHSGFGDWDTSVRVAREFPNVYLELTAVYVAHDFGIFPAGSGTPVPLLSHLQLNGIIEFMVEKASSKKILFGTDMPWYSPHYAVGAVAFARIDDDARHDIFYRNAEDLLRKLATGVWRNRDEK
ncbi:MAG: amidohydrolase [Firmicutes bacterium]|nr:amidohydrolase [Bacillota bacterium]